MPGGGSLLLDTNAVIALFEGETALLALLESASAVCVPAVVLGELYYGARHSGRPEENAGRVAAFAASVLVLGCDAETAAVYGEVKAGLRARGTPIPENDVWIAAVARQHGLPLATRDAHFGHVPGLPLADWS